MSCARIASIMKSTNTRMRDGRCCRRMPDLARALAEELVRNAERFCPYVKMARQGIASVVAVVEWRCSSDTCRHDAPAVP